MKYILQQGGTMVNGISVYTWLSFAFALMGVLGILVVSISVQLILLQRRVKFLEDLQISNMEDDGTLTTRTFREIAECQQQVTTEKSSV